MRLVSCTVINRPFCKCHGTQVLGAIFVCIGGRGVALLFGRVDHSLSLDFYTPAGVSLPPSPSVRLWSWRRWSLVVA